MSESQGKTLVERRKTNKLQHPQKGAYAQNIAKTQVLRNLESDREKQMKYSRHPSTVQPNTIIKELKKNMHKKGNN